MAERVSEVTPTHFSLTSAPPNTVPTSRELWIPQSILPFTGCISPSLLCLSIGNLYRPIPILAFMDLVRKSWLLVVLQPVRVYNGSYSLNRGASGMLRQDCTITCPLDMMNIEEKFPRHEFISYCHPYDEWSSFPRAGQPLRGWK